MPAISIQSFGGEMPRVSKRALGEFAQTNRDLLATSTEFRPLLDDSVISTIPAGVKTIYRMARDSTGALRTNDAAGWITEVADKNYVKGQINDSKTERTYVSFNDGSAAPRAIDATGQNRLLGVPAPSAVTPVMNQGDYFSANQANTWLTHTFIHTVAEAARTALVPAIVKNYYMQIGDGSQPVAGPYGVHGLWWIDVNETDYWNLRVLLDEGLGEAIGLYDSRIGSERNNGTIKIRITCIPAWGEFTGVTAFKAVLAGIIHPKTSLPLFNTTKIDAITSSFVGRFLVTGNAGVKVLRDSLDDVIRDVKIILDFRLTTALTAPVLPSKPTVPEYVTDAGGVTTRSAEWIVYDSALVSYNSDKSALAINQTTITNEKQARISKLVELLARADTLTREIENMYVSLRDGIEDWVLEGLQDDSAFITDTNPGGMFTVDENPVVDTRFYVTTFTTDWGEESAPSPVSTMIEVDQFSTVTITRPTPPDGRNIAKWNLYRSSTGSQESQFQLVSQVFINTATILDDYTQEELKEPLQSLTWLEPPADLRGMIGAANGVMAAFFDNTVCFCDPYHPYAWPVEYRISLEFPVVGLCSFGQNIFVGTLANPYLISGSDSASMSAQKLDAAQSCVSRRSMVSTQGGVLYASPDGICYASTNGVEVLTLAMFSREDWQLLDPVSIVAAMHEGVYYFTYTGNGGGCYALDGLTKKLCHVSAMPATAMYVDILTDSLYYAYGTSLKRAFVSGRRTGLWKTGVLTLPAQRPLSWLKVYGDQSVDTPAIVRMYGDGDLRHTATLSNIQPVRLPSGRYLEYEIEIESKSRITKCVLAGDTQELQSI